ncbi:MAG: VWA domain-containing protein [Bradymonadaceae bacterium]
MDLTFAYPWVLVALLAIPVLAVVRFLPGLRRRRRGTFMLSTTGGVEATGRGFRHYLRPVADVLILVAFSLLIIAMARPQTVAGDKLEVEGIDIFMALDMSGSMRAVDMSEGELKASLQRGEKPQNRFQEAVSTLENFVKSRKHDRIGMAVFAKEAFLQFPLTLDYRTILEMLGRLELGDIEPGGTVIGNALGRAVAGLEESKAESKIVILITDGDRRGGNISPSDAADLAKKHGIKVFPILVGKDGPTLVPVKMRGMFGGSGRTKYKKQKFPVDPGLLKEIASTTGGKFYRATDGDKLETRLHEILDQFERTKLKDRSRVDRTERYFPFLLWAIALIGLQFLTRFTLLRTFP